MLLHIVTEFNGRNSHLHWLFGVKALLLPFPAPWFSQCFASVLWHWVSHELAVLRDLEGQIQITLWNFHFLWKLKHLPPLCRRWCSVIFFFFLRKIRSGTTVLGFAHTLLLHRCNTAKCSAQKVGTESAHKRMWSLGKGKRETAMHLNWRLWRSEFLLISSPRVLLKSLLKPLSCK